MENLTNTFSPAEDPLALISRIATKLNSIWLRTTYPFAAFGANVSVHHSCDIQRSVSPHIWIGNNIYLASDIWLNIAPGTKDSTPKIFLGNGCKIGRRCMISARNQIVLETDILLSPSVLIMDHNHEFRNPEDPIHTQGVTQGGRILVQRNC